MNQTAPTTSRRALLGSGLAAAAAISAPVAFSRAAAAAPAGYGVFGYGVASGDPLADRVVIWTRATPSPDAVPGSGKGGPVDVTWRLARDRDMKHVIGSGVVRVGAATDHTVKVDVTGLRPYTRYYYQFSAKGSHSPVGVTRTAPDEHGKTHALRFAQVSCSNLTGGWFSAYREIAERDDLDFVLHLGDYIYEYGNAEDRYGPEELEGVRDHNPGHEILTLEDYRLRYAQYRADNDCRAAHQAHPFIVEFDDHEVADNTWSGGAVNHNPGEGGFIRRRSHAMQAWQEWMPIRLPQMIRSQVEPHQGIQFFRRFRFGSLADLSMVETRQNRSKQVGSFVIVGTGETNDEIYSPDRHIMEPEQMTWLKRGISAKGRQWHLIGNQVMVSPIAWPGQYVGGSESSVAINADAWDGYRFDQTTLLAHMAAQPLSHGDTVILTGDIHSSWVENLVGDPSSMIKAAAAAVGSGDQIRSRVVDLPEGQDSSIPPLMHRPVDVDRVAGLASARAAGSPAGVEFVCPSITSDGVYEQIHALLKDPTVSLGTVAAATGALKLLNPSLAWVDGVGHGYVLIDVTPSRVQADYVHAQRPSSDVPDTRLLRRPAYSVVASWQTLRGTRQATEASAPIGARKDQPYVAQKSAHGRVVGLPVPTIDRFGKVSAVATPR